MDGLILVDKPRGVTSHDVVDRVRRERRLRPVGHAGTLDPRATGLLLVLVGRATKLAPYLSDLDKEYDTTIRLGITTTTDDLDGPVVSESAPMDRAGLEAALARFTGTFEQRPPAFSAVKVDGKRAYRKARAGEPLLLAPRRVTIHRLEPLSWEPLRLRVVCSAGTYIRSLARDLGGAVDQLRRTRVGPFALTDVSDAVRLPEAAVGFLPAVTVADARLFVDGMPLTAEGSGLVRVFGPDGFIGIGRVDGGRLRAERVLYNRSAPS